MQFNDKDHKSSIIAEHIKGLLCRAESNPGETIKEEFDASVYRIEPATTNLYEVPTDATERSPGPFKRFLSKFRSAKNGD